MPFSFQLEITTLSGAPALQVITDGTDIFWVDSTTEAGSHLYKYTVSSNSFAKFVDQSNFRLGIGGDVELQEPVIIMFAGNIYVMRVFRQGLDWDPGDPVAKVWKVNPSSGAVTPVWNPFPLSTNQAAGDFRGLHATLQATENEIVASVTEWPSIGGATAEFITRWSANGSSWAEPTLAYSETIDMGSTSGVSIGSRDFRTLGITDRYATTTGTFLYQFSNGVWDRQPNAGSGQTLFEVAADHFWTRDDFGEYTDDFSTFETPAALAFQMYGLNMPFATNVDFDSTTIRQLDTDNPPTGIKTFDTMATDGFAAGSQTNTMIRLNDGTVWLFMKAFGATFPNWSVWKSDITLDPTPNAWQGAGGLNNSPPQMPLPCDIDADGEFLYIAALGAANTPILLKISTDLDSDAELKFNPALGTNIGVICGREDADTVWIGGDFGGTDVLERSDDGAETFEIKDNGAFGPLRIFTVGPDSDDRVLLVDDGINIQETLNNGVSWTAINAGLSFSPVSLARLAIDVKEMVYGNESAVSDNVDYSLDSGGEFEDLTVAPLPSEDVKRVIIN